MEIFVFMNPPAARHPRCAAHQSPPLCANRCAHCELPDGRWERVLVSSYIIRPRKSPPQPRSPSIPDSAAHAVCPSARARQFSPWIPRTPRITSPALPPGSPPPLPRGPRSLACEKTREREVRVSPSAQRLQTFAAVEVIVFSIIAIWAFARVR